MNKTKLLIITCIVVLAAAIGMTVLFLNEKQSKNELVQGTNTPTLHDNTTS